MVVPVTNSPLLLVIYLFLYKLFQDMALAILLAQLTPLRHLLHFFVGKDGNLYASVFGIGH